MTRLLACALIFVTAASSFTLAEVPPKAKKTSLSGTWVLVSSEGSVQRHTRIVLRPNGEFQFVGPGFRSEGKYSTIGETITLTYLKSDGIALKQPGKRTMELVEGGNAVLLDRFKYGRQPYVAPTVPTHR